MSTGKFFSINLVGSLESGEFQSVNDVYVKYSIIAGPDWIISSGKDVGITQIARSRWNEQSSAQQFVWNQPISISYRSYNCFGWPQIVVSVYHFDLFGNDQILGYGCTHLPVLSADDFHRQTVKIYSPQSTSFVRQIVSWLTGRRPELVDANLYANGECRSALQMTEVGKIELIFDLISKDVINNGYTVN